jgi:hypothetical protein
MGGRPVSSDTEQLQSVSFSTTYTVLPESAAVVLGYDMTKTHYCMECGDRVGEASMANHARWHAHLPPKPKVPKDTNGRQAGGSS